MSGYKTLPRKWGNLEVRTTLEYLDASSGKLHADGRLGLQAKLIAGEPAEQV